MLIDAAYLAPTLTVDADHPAVVTFARRRVDGIGGEVERAVALYYAVRDEIRYDGYAIDLSVAGLSASRVLATGRGWCVSKAVLLAACCRAVGIPARLGYADVKNHLSTERMRRIMGTDEYYWHGYTDILLAGNWFKATPAFNVELCQKFGLKPLEFDGTADSIYHAFDEDGRQHMEYLRYRGEFAEVPIATIRQEFATRYPNFLQQLADGDFAQEVERETAGAKRRAEKSTS